MQLSPQRAFVIQLSSGTTKLDHDPVGRVEHVVSHQAMEFDSLDVLWAFIARVLREIDESKSSSAR